MRALRWMDRESVDVADVAMPDLKPGQVLVKVAYCGICGSDLEEFWHGPVMLPVAKHPLSGRQVPLTLGHEAAGVVAALGPGTGTQVSVGQKVSLESMRSCGRCRYCQAGTDYLCGCGW